MKLRRQRILDWLNEERAKLGLRPLKRIPDGKRIASSSCPIARGLAECEDSPYYLASVGPESALVFRDDSSIQIKLPEYVQGFITRHDWGLHPIRALRSNRPLKYKD